MILATLGDVAACSAITVAVIGWCLIARWALLGRDIER